MATQKEGQDIGWHILNDSGQKFCEYDSVDNFEDTTESNIPNAPQEGGRLYSYDKVRSPTTASVQLLFTGDYSKQGASLSKLKGYLNSTDAFSIFTPSRELANMSVVGMNVTRTATKNAHVLVVEVMFQEVMNPNPTNKISPANPTSVDKVAQGNVEAKDMSLLEEAESAMNEAKEQKKGVLDTVKEKFQAVKKSVSSAVATVKENINTVRSTVAEYVKEVKAVQNWARSTMVSVNSEISAVKSTFTSVREAVSLNGIKRTFWSGASNAKDTLNVGKSILKGFD